MNNTTKTSITSVMTLDQFQVFCKSYFEEKHKEMTSEVIAMVNNMNPIDFSEWSTKLYNEMHDIARAPIKNYVKFVRGDYDVMNPGYLVDPIRIPENKKLLDKYTGIYELCFNEFVQKNSFIPDKHDQITQHHRDLAEEASMNIEVEGKKFRAIKKFTVLWEGWDCDSKGWIVEDEGKKKIVISNHGQLYFGDQENLSSKIEEYQRVIQETQEALDLVTSPVKKLKP